MKAGTWHVRRPAKPVDFAVALEAWTEAIVPLLEGVASHYNATITYPELEAKLFRTTGYQTRMMVSTWLEKLVDDTRRRTVDEGLPPLTSLIVGKGDGAVGPRYFNAEHPEGSVADELQLELVAAADRLACYRRYCSDVPADAKPELTKTYQFRTGNRPRVEKAAPDPRFCPKHHLALRPNGACDFCD